MSGFSLPEQITVWTEATATVDGGHTYVAGVLMAARIASHIEEIIDAEGKTVITQKAVYTRTNLATGTYVFIGDAEGDASPAAGSARVVSSIEIPSMSDMNKVLI